MAKKKTITKKAIKKDEIVKLNIDFEDAMRKALNTPLPKNKKTKKVK